MSKSWTWIAPYTFAILALFLAGPLLSSLALVQSVSVPYLQLSGPHAIRLVANLLALVILWIFAFAASQQIPDNGRGSSFLRNLVLPLTTLVVILFANKAFRTVGLPLIEQMGPSSIRHGAMQSVSSVPVSGSLQPGCLTGVRCAKPSLPQTDTAPRGAGALRG